MTRKEGKRGKKKTNGKQKTNKQTKKKTTKQNQTNNEWQQQNRPKSFVRKAITREKLAASSLNGGLLGSPSSCPLLPTPGGYRLLKMTSSQHGQLLMNWRV